MRTDLVRTIEHGVDFLSREQRPDGSFLCLVSTVMDDYRKAETVPAIVPTNIVLSSLIRFPKEDAVAQAVMQGAAAFLHAEKNAYWSLNYWFRRSEWFTNEPYPDDLDDTFCALAALYQYDPAPFDGEAMAKIATMLTSAEKEEGGPYDMWLVPPEGKARWEDIDLVVNSNIGFFLSLHGVSLPKVNAFIESSIDAEEYEFPYNTPYPAIYFISRFYHGEKVQRMIELLLEKQETDGKWENPLRTALAITALINFSGDMHLATIEKGIEYLERMQEEDGSWQPYSFYYQMNTPEKTLYAGSASITTALCLEALHRVREYDVRSSEQGRLRVEEEHAQSEVQQCAQIRNVIQERFATCRVELQQQAKEFSDALLSGDLGKQILLPAYAFRASLGKKAKDVSDDVVIQLGAANAFGWMAYTIFDDCMDHEGELHRIPLAQFCLRASLEFFLSAVPSAKGFPEFVRKTFDQMDSANSWEITHTRHRTGEIPDYGNDLLLAERSFGHALGPVAILFLLGYHKDSAETQYLLDFFEHVLIARQLDDDMHDWQEDLKNGQVNAVAARIAREEKVDLQLLFLRPIEELQRRFWETTVAVVCDDIERHLVAADAAVDAIPLITQPLHLTNCLVPIEQSIQTTRREREEAQKFFKTYQAPPTAPAH